MSKTKTKKTPSKKTKAAKAAKAKTANAVFSILVDESGSMSSIADATISGFNEYVTNLQGNFKGTETYFSAVKFDSRGVVKLQVGANIKDAVKLSRENYSPCASTPLYDAIAKTIIATDEVVSKQPKDAKVIVAIQTDGHENASAEYTQQSVKSLIEDRTAKGWQFVFLGAGIDAQASSGQLGISTGSTISYGRGSSQQLFRSLARSSSLYASGEVACMSFTESDRDSVGEKELLSKVRGTPVNIPVPSAATSTQQMADNSWNLDLTVK